ncbi:MAG: hypothetical protein HYR51_07630 [Candidatus Rokubacteria bacterium]|nr:hypothetical protein [Candidatus Rokubacteria bacterium]
MVRVASSFALVGTAVAMLAGGADARPATVSDFAICNQEAAAATGGSALPAPGGTTPRPAPPVAPGSPERPDTAASGGMATGTDSTGKLVAGARDPRDEGMAVDHAGDAAYQAAYRDCMARRGITSKPAS